MDSQARRSGNRRTQSRHSGKIKKAKDKDKEVVKIVEEMKKIGIRGL